VLVGPLVDPGRQAPDTASEYWRRLDSAWRELPAHVRRRTHLWQIAPSRKEAEDLAINLVQTRARVILQNSHREAYGLTVSEAMWKGTVVVASEVGGIPERLRHDHNGLLTRDIAGGAEWAATVDRPGSRFDHGLRHPAPPIEPWSAVARIHFRRRNPKSRPAPGIESVASTYMRLDRDAIAALISCPAFCRRVANRG
jgi:glycosyltransferase involved in cell wall biosynthesis